MNFSKDKYGHNITETLETGRGKKKGEEEVVSQRMTQRGKTSLNAQAHAQHTGCRKWRLPAAPLLM